MNTEAEIFDTAVGLPVPERSEYLEEACSGQPGMRPRIEALLQSHETKGFMESHASADCFRDAGDEIPQFFPEQSGQTIGRYLLLRKIGEGGFGVVWLAEQVHPVRRRVALKIIRAGMDTREAIARFEAERQALAMMNHPGIARVFDVGAAENGRPYFAMELVEGIAVTQFCDEHSFTIRQRLGLFAEICDAISHAHQKGVIHRDIKPSNVMVTLTGGKPVAKIIDFGIAKAIEGKLTNNTVFTRFEHFMGTPAYMSPEQTAFSGLDVDTRSDIYGLGILLYELLSGSPPFDGRSLLLAGYGEMRRIVCEVEPVRPSARFGPLKAGERSILARARGVAPEKLDRLVERELDWIVMKAVEKDRTRRYATANGLALDIGRFLADEPVSAGPPSATYRFRKFAKRHKGAIAATAAMTIVLLAATGVSVNMAYKAKMAEKLALQKAASEVAARQEADFARKDGSVLVKFFSGVLRGEDDGGAVTITEAMDRAINDLDKSIANDAGRKYESDEGILWVLHSLGFTRRIIPLQEKIRNLHLANYGPGNGKSLLAGLDLAFYRIKSDPSEESLEKAAGILEGLLPYEQVWPPENFKEWLDTLTTLAYCCDELNRNGDAVRYRRKILELCRDRYSDESRKTLDAMMALSNSLSKSGLAGEAIEVQEECLKLQRAVNPPLHRKTLQAMHGLANIYYKAGNRGKAIQLRQEVSRDFQTAFGKKDADTLIAMHNLAESLFEKGSKTEAIELMEEVMKFRPSVSGLENRDTIEAMHDLAAYYYETGELAKALELRTQVLELCRKVPGSTNPDLVEAMTNLAVSLRAAGKTEEAVKLEDSAREHQKPLIQPGSE